MKYLEQVRKIQIETSNFCNASCIGCRRTDQKSLTAKYEIKNMDIEFLPISVFEKLFSDELFKGVEVVEFCGTIDEPLAHPNILTIIKMLAEIKTDIFLSIHTNGAIKNEDFYAELALIMSLFKKHELRFSIDGNKEQHFLYRGPIDYDKIFDNARIFISYGGYATWQMLTFPWNESNINECERQAYELGFRKFVVRRDRTDSSNFEVKKIKMLRSLNLQSDEKAESNKDFIYPEESKIDCSYRKDFMIFIDFKGNVLPCCFMANSDITRKNDLSRQLDKEVFNVYDKNFNNLNFHSLTNILDHIWYSQQLVKSWSNKFESENPKLLVCNQSCGSKSPLLGQHKKVSNFYNE
jgi:MoaA/NifB/PqqE/SkfB family radical SAM enzyme